MATVERKMNIDELCLCFCKERKRFKAEFERAKINNCRIYLLNRKMQHGKSIILGKYRSKYNPIALIASLLGMDCKIQYYSNHVQGRNYWKTNQNNIVPRIERIFRTL